MKLLCLEAIMRCSQRRMTSTSLRCKKVTNDAFLQQDKLEEVGDIDTCANEKKQHKVDVAISNSFGFGGHNSVCVFAPFKESR